MKNNSAKTTGKRADGTGRRTWENESKGTILFEERKGNFYLQHSSTLHWKQSTMINTMINTAVQSLMPKMIYSVFLLFSSKNIYKSKCINLSKKTTYSIRNCFCFFIYLLYSPLSKITKIYNLVDLKQEKM